MINGSGLIEVTKPGNMSIPSEDDYTLKDRAAFNELYLPKMQFTLDRVNLEFFKNYNEMAQSVLILMPPTAVKLTDSKPHCYLCKAFSFVSARIS